MARSFPTLPPRPQAREKALGTRLASPALIASLFALLKYNTRLITHQVPSPLSQDWGGCVFVGGVGEG